LVHRHSRSALLFAQVWHVYSSVPPKRSLPIRPGHLQQQQRQPVAQGDPGKIHTGK